MPETRKKNKLTRILRWVARVLLFQLILINISAAFHAYRLTHFYDDPKLYQQQNEGSILTRTWRLMVGKKMARSPLQYIPTSDYDSLQFTLSNGIKIRAWYIPADSARGSVIMVHGLGSNKGHPLNEASEFRAMHYNTLLLDLRAHGESEGKAFSIGYKETEEIQAAFAWLQARGEQKIILWGMSVGAVLVTKAVHDHQLNPAAVILEMPFGSLQDHLVSRGDNLGFPGKPYGFFVTFWVGVEQGYWGYGHRTARYAQSLQCPVLVQWGRRDDFVKQHETEEVYNAIPGNNKKLVVYEESGHVPLCWADNELWIKEVSRFLNNK